MRRNDIVNKGMAKMGIRRNEFIFCQIFFKEYNWMQVTKIRHYNH